SRRRTASSLRETVSGHECASILLDSEAQDLSQRASGWPSNVCNMTAAVAARATGSVGSYEVPEPVSDRARPQACTGVGHQRLKAQLRAAEARMRVGNYAPRVLMSAKNQPREFIETNRLGAGQLHCPI